MDYLPTGIETLDRLLGGRGFLRGTTILIRGQAGTGKTTLAFQIAANVLRLKGRRRSVVFGAIEEEASLALGRIYESLRFRRQRPELPPGMAPADSPFRHARLGSDWEAFRSRYSKFYIPKLMDFWSGQVPQPHEGDAPSPNLDDALEKFGNVILSVGARRDALEGSEGVIRRVRLDLVVIDSLNALVYGAQAHYGNFYDERQVILALLRLFRRLWPAAADRPTVILTAEDASGVPLSPAESYLADAVVELSHAPVALRIPLRDGEAFPARDDDSWASQSVTHRFCQVPKARGLANQGRAVCYGLVAGSGVKFFPTYGVGGALVSLFAENAPQFAHIASFRSVDVASSYPGLYVQEFSISGAQRMFSVRRHAERVPRGRSLLVTNLDEYWVGVLARAKQLWPIPGAALNLGSVHGAVIAELSAKERSDNPGMPYYQADAEHFVAVPYLGNVGMLVYRKDVLDKIGARVPETWEDLREICLRLKGRGRRWGARPLPWKFLIETQTYDTLTATALELWWSDGTDWVTRKVGKAGLEVDLKGRSAAHFARPIRLLARMIHEDGIIPRGSSVDPGHPSGVDRRGVADWVFARHWYSTYVDIMTKCEANGEPLARFDKGAEFGVAPIPVTSERAHAFPDHAAVPHHSAWGEWHLAIQAGSESVELGIDLINNLTTSRKLNDLAFSGAGLPVLEESYRLHGKSMCPYIDKTFDQVRAEFLRPAKTRLAYENYRRVGRILFGALRSLVSNPGVHDVHGRGVQDILDASLKDLGPLRPGPL